MATVTGAMAPTKPLTALDVCDRCGAQAYVRVLLANSGELLFCAHHGREHAKALAKVAVDIQDESNRLSEPQPQYPAGTARPARTPAPVRSVVPASLCPEGPAGSFRAGAWSRSAAYLERSLWL